MAVASHKTTATPPTQPSLPKIQPDNYKSIIYDDKDNIPLHSLLAYVAGSSWGVTYYKQVVSKHNDLREIDPGQPNVYQQYERINKMEIRVGTPLNSSYDSEQGITTVTGSGLIYPFMIPNVADYFTSDAGDAKVGLFKITNVERKNFSRDSVFAIDYEMIGYIDTLGALYDDLVSKVIREYHFSKDRLVEGLQPILTSSDYDYSTTMQHRYREIVQYYFQTFFNRHFSTLVIPGQEYGVYDSFLVDYLFKIVDSFDVYEMKQVKQLAIDNDPYAAQPQFWSMMLNRDYQMLTYCNRKMALISKRAFSPNGFMHGIYFSNIDYLIYPSNPDLTTKLSVNHGELSVSMQELQEVSNVYGTMADLINNQYIGATATYPLTHTVLTDDSYVLSNAFYDDTAQKSVLEILTKDYLKGQPLDPSMMSALVDSYRNLGRLEQFYYGPILLTLIKEVNRSTYS